MAGTTLHPETERAATAVTARCAVLAPAGASVPVELLEGLTRRGMVVSVVSEPPLVMVALARGETAAVVLVDRASLPYVDALVAAIRRYHPRTMIWAFEPGEDGGLRLARLNGHVAHAAASAPAPDRAEPHPSPRDHDMTPDAPSRQPRTGRSAGEPAAAAAGGARRAGASSASVERGADEPLISQEELEMLLGHSADPAEVGSLERGETS